MKNVKTLMIKRACYRYASSLCGCCVCAFDLLLCLMIFNLWGHFKILIHNLDSFPRPAAATTETNQACHNATIAGSEMYSKSELEDVAVQLKECIEHHKVISKYVFCFILISKAKFREIWLLDHKNRKSTSDGLYINRVKKKYVLIQFFFAVFVQLFLITTFCF